VVVEAVDGRTRVAAADPREADAPMHPFDAPQPSFGPAETLLDLADDVVRQPRVRSLARTGRWPGSWWPV